MYVVIAYDIVADRRRRKLHKALQGWLEHVQKSVFEGELEDARFPQLLDRIRGVIDFEEDTVRVYRLCLRCRPQTEVIGTGIYVETDDPDVIL